MISITNLHATVEGEPILKGLSLEVKPGEIHAIMGPNGAGKSTLAKVLAGHPSYEVTDGEVLFQGNDILELEADERSHAGLFMSFQYPIEVPGVTNSGFLMTAVNSARKARGETPFSEEVFETLLEEKMELVGVPKVFAKRNVNEGFSGGEKKRNEILQMAVLDPKLAILDETDSGLDIDAMRIVADGLNKLMSPERGLILITHYQRLLDYIKPDHVHVMINGRIVKSGGPELAQVLEEKGYDWLISEAKAC
jgi:Fe-S cluster assembly ATP-binding protein